MFASLPQGAGRLLAVVTIPLFASTAQAQWGPFGDPCGTCATTAAIAPPQYAAAPIAYNPCISTVSVAPCMQPVTETVYRDVPVTQYVAVKKTVKKPVLRTVYEDRPVTAYKQVMEERVAEVPTVSYQTVQECRPVTINRSYWQTVSQPVMKVSPCQYDPRPGLAGWFNRTSYNVRMAFTPDQIRQRQFVPNVQTVAVPTSRTVAIPGTRQVTYSVAKLQPYETTQRVARVITDYEDVEVTAYEPHTVTKTVAVGNQTRWAFVDPYGGTTARATASEPTPARAAQKEDPKKTTRSGGIELNHYEQPQYQLNHSPAPTQQASPALFNEDPQTEPTPIQAAPAPIQAEPNLFEHGNARPATPTAARVAGWRASRSGTVTVSRPALTSPAIPSVAAN
jgi:hypothetical protein